MSGLKVGLIVDGHGDHVALRRKFKGYAFVLKTNGSRGHLTSAKELIYSSRKEMQMLVDLGCSIVCLVTDREARTLTASKFCTELSQHLPARTERTNFVAACADRMIENWILADIVEVSKKSVDLKVVSRQKCWEGKHGKNELKKHFVKGKDYNEVKHGEKFFSHIRESVARKNSKSFDAFLRQIGR